MSVPPDGGEPSVEEPRGAPQPEADASGDADVHAFLIADVRGYTRFTQERGDEEAARLAGRFAEVARAVVEEHRGHVLELRGDEALVVFGSPRWAIRGAVALQQRFVEETIADPSLPLTVGIGLDAGEAVPVEGGYRGGALNVAARLCSLARAGEVLASREIIHLARRVDGVRFTERGQKEVKGLDQPVHVVAVRSEERDSAEAIAPFVQSSAPTPTSRKRRRVIAAVVAFAVVVTSVAFVARRSGGSSQIAPNSIGVLDPESGKVTDTVGLAAARPGAVAAWADAVWVTNPDVGKVTVIGSKDHVVHDHITVGDDPTAIAAGFDAVWVVNSGGPSVSRISPDTNSVVQTITEGIGNGPAGIAVGEGSVWVTNRFDGTISRIDPNRDKVVETIPVGLDPRGIAFGFGSVWVGLAGSNKVVRINPLTSSVQPIDVGNAPVALAVGSDAVWVANTLADTVSRIDPGTNQEAGAVPVRDGPAAIAVVQGTVWVANEGDGTLSRIEPAQAPVSEAIGSIPQGLTSVGGDLWVSVRGSATSHGGGTLKLLSKEHPSTLDSTVTYESYAWALLHLMSDGLVAFEPIGGTNATLVPDLATSIPTPTAGGRRYTFVVRRGIRYSDGEVVSPTDFRRALERGFRLDMVDAHAHPLYGGLVGADACGPRSCDLSDGIVTDDETGTITFNLREPDPEFLFKLTLPFAYPVPPFVPDEEQAAAGIPGTGPYKLEAPKTRKGLALIRNRNFSDWAPAAQPEGYVDRIEWTFGVSPQAQFKAVAAGDADFLSEAYATGGLEEMLVRFPAQVHSSPIADTDFAVLNTKVPPFDDVRVRRAVNFALDRDRVVQILGGDAAAVSTCQQLPPNFPGYEPYCPYTLDPGPEGSWTAPDFERAQGLVDRSGTARIRVVIEYAPAYLGVQGGLLGDYLKEVLHELGYDASVRTVSPADLGSPSNEFQMALTGWVADYPAASNFITNQFTCGASIVPSAGFCDRRIDAMIERATRMQADDPASSGAIWAEIDRAIVDKAPYVWLDNVNSIDFVSERVGNYQRSLQWGVLLNQLWVQ